MGFIGGSVGETVEQIPISWWGNKELKEWMVIPF
jgi:hypothetical protein